MVAIVDLLSCLFGKDRLCFVLSKSSVFPSGYDILALGYRNSICSIAA